METSVSLLERLRTAPDEAAWRRLDDLYRPMIRRWVLRDRSLGDEAEDIVQEVMQVLVRELPGFHRQRNGSFRHWLRTIINHRVMAYHRGRQKRPHTLGATPEESPLAQLSDPKSQLSRQWDEEHDRYVLRRLLELVEPMFEPKTVAVFRRVVLDEVPAAQVADELGLSVSAVYLAKSHLLKKLREEAEGFIE
jgi:RNA polymerase sigma-70 factor (ECF subfamily)